MKRRLAWFVLVGVAAALTHMGVYARAQPHLWPEVANALGFGVAFFVSFAGHRMLSFSDAGTTVAQSFTRFMATALAGFAANEVVFIALLRGLDVPGLLALFVALVVAAGQTFVLSRYWAFRR